jgi:glutamate racemase
VDFNSSDNCQLTTDNCAASRSSAGLGVFDSGVGGLTVVAALQQLLPYENIIYVGDTARVPYGGKSAETIQRYSKEIADLLASKGAKIFVIACNTASALAAQYLKEIYSIPLQGVIEPGAAAALKATRNGIIGVIGTKATIGSNAYSDAIHALEASIHVHSTACPLLVPLVEEGFFEDEITDAVLRRYLQPLLAQGCDTLVLGCTHYPLLKKRIAAIVGPHITLVDSAENCALAVRELLSKNGLLAQSKNLGQLDIFLTDTSKGFLHVAARELALKINSVATISL